MVQTKNLDAFLCPITGEIMKDPVVDKDGNSYERQAIMEWLSHESVSPLTRNALRAEDLTPNRALRELLEEQGLIPTSSDESKSNLADDVAVSVRATADGEVGLIRVSVADDDSRTHAGTKTVCVIDVSYSMDHPATMADDSDGKSGLSLLDIVKHATRAVIESLSDDDEIAVVAYATDARVVLPMTTMTTENKKTAWDQVAALRTCGSTNLWDGLLKAMDLIRNETTHSNIVLLTDGMPNIFPPRGTLPTLERYIDANPTLECTISTFGFGYQLDSKLLRDIAVLSNGHYCFIPDSSFVGTVFVNMISNILATAVPSSTLSIEAENGVEILDTMSGSVSATKTSWGYSFQLPPLIFGQNLDILVKLGNTDTNSPSFRASLSSKSLPTDQICQASTETGNSEDFTTAILRSDVVAFLQKAEDIMERKTVPKETIDDVLLQMVNQDLRALSLKFPSNPVSKPMASLREDVNGQISEAFSRMDWYKKWGVHYLPSLARAHVLQQCTNFKDPGVQVYATGKFGFIRDYTEDQFFKLPPPKPSYTPRVAVTSMSTYYNSNAPCFAKGEIVMSDGSRCDVSQVRSGQEVVTPEGASRIRCVVRTRCTGGIQELVTLKGGVMVTPWHPVRSISGGSWAFPSSLAPIDMHVCEYVYSFVLEGNAPAMRIGPYEAVSLGHGIQGDPVASHAFLGTHKVIDNLKTMTGWEGGYVTLGEKPAVRDPLTGLIVKFVQTEGAKAESSIAVSPLDPKPLVILQPVQ